jgi:hypothetical protein
MALDERTVNRLYNFKFVDAADRLAPDDHSPPAEVVRQLAARYGNPGWFHGTEAAFVGAVLRVLGVKFDGE